VSKVAQDLLFWAADHVYQWRGYAIGLLTLLVYGVVVLIYELYIANE